MFSDEKPIVSKQTNLRCIEDDRRETGRHFAVEPNLDTRLYLVLGLNQCVQEFVSVDDGLAIIGHKANDCRIPLVYYLRERS